MMGPRATLERQAGQDRVGLPSVVDVLGTASMGDDDDAFDFDLPHLTAKDRLIRIDGPWRTTKPLPVLGSGNWHDYTYGYKKAADVLASHIEADGSPGGWTLLYPTITLYRHHLELLLKEILRLGAELEGAEVNSPREHDLLALWRLVRECAERALDSEQDGLEGITRCVREFHELDRRGTAFRYPDVVSTPSPGSINIRNLAHVVDKLSFELGCLWSSMAYYGGCFPSVDLHLPNHIGEDPSR